MLGCSIILSMIYAANYKKLEQAFSNMQVWSQAQKEKGVQGQRFQGTILARTYFVNRTQISVKRIYLDGCQKS